MQPSQSSFQPTSTWHLFDSQRLDNPVPFASPWSGWGKRTEPFHPHTANSRHLNLSIFYGIEGAVGRVATPGPSGDHGSGDGVRRRQRWTFGGRSDSIHRWPLTEKGGMSHMVSLAAWMCKMALKMKPLARFPLAKCSWFQTLKCLAPDFPSEWSSI